MEPPESKTGPNEPKQPTRSKRRISSILKAPRTPLKSIAPDNEDPQEETVEPTEKKRKSRRVSFASTDDIHVFVKDFKSGSSLENLLQDLSGAGEETLDNTGVQMVEDGGPPVIDMETLLNGPLHTPQDQNKENIIGYGAQNDLGDKTMVFSEDDTAFMNMTHSHTIIIDGKKGENDGNVFGGGNLDFATAARGAKSSSFENSNRDEATAFKTCSASSKGLIEETEFVDFLASLTRSSASGRAASSGASASSATLCSQVPSPAPKMDQKKFLARLCAQKSAVDQENHVPLGTRMPAHRDRSSRGSHGLKDRTMNLEEQENMDLTTSHTAIISDKGMLKCETVAPSAEQEDMEFTRSQTLVIDSKTCHVAKSLNSTAKDMSMLAPNKTHAFSGADRDMELTAPFMGYTEEIPNPSTKKNEKLWLFPPTNTVPLSGQMEKARAQVDANVASCLWPASSSDPEDMEMTRSQNVVIDSKNCLTPSVGKQGNVSCIHASNKTVVFSKVDHDMEMTDAFTGRLEVNECSFNRNASGIISHAGRRDSTERISIRMDDIGSNGLRLGALSNFEDMEVTRTQSVIDSKNYLTPLLGKSISGSCMQDMNKSTTFAHRGRTDNRELAGGQMGAKDVKSSLLCTPSKPNDMDLTRNQNVVIQSKKCTNLSVKSQSYLSSSNRTIMFSDMDRDMDMTDAITGVIQEFQDSSSKRQENTGYSFSKSNLLCTPSSNPNDMDMTRDQTVFIESKNFPLSHSVKSQSYLSSNKTIMFSNMDRDMDMTDANTGLIQENQDPSSKRQENTGHSFSKSNLLCAPSNLDDMDLTRNQTIVIESKNFPPSHSVKSQSYLSSNKTIMFSDVDPDMDMTDAITGIIQEFQDPSSKRQENTGHSFSKSNLLCTPSSNPNDMDMTRDQTIVIESKICPINPLVKSQSYLSSSNKTVMFSDMDQDMDMTDAITGIIQENQDPSSKRQENTGRSFSKSNLLCAPSNLDDMDLTRNQTVVIESKNFPPSHSVKSQSYLSSNKTIMFSDVDPDMDMTDAITGLIEVKRSSSSEGRETISGSFPKSTLLYTPSNPDDMDMTRNRTIVFESKNRPINPLIKSKSDHSTSNKTIMFSDVGHDMEMTDEIMVIQENQGSSPKRRETTSCSSQKSSLAFVDAAQSNDMDMTRSEVVFNESKNCLLNPTSGVESRTSYQSPPNKTIVFSDAAHDMDITNAFTSRILKNADICTGGNKTPDRPSSDDKTTECSHALEASSFDPNDMEMTRSQTVVLDSKRCGTVKGSLSTARKSISLILPSSKARMFPAGLRGIQVSKALVGNDIDCNKLPSGWGMAAMFSSTTNDVSSSEPEVMEKSTELEAAGDPNDLEIRNESLLECQDVGRQNYLPLGETRNIHRESVYNKTQISSCEDYGVEMIETPVGQSMTCGLPPTGGDEAEIAFRIHEANSMGVCVQVSSPGSSCTFGVVSSEGVENENIHRVCVRASDEDMATSSTSAMSETSVPASSKAHFPSETHYDMAADQSVPACTDGAGSRVRSSPAPEFVPPPCLPSFETVAEGTTLRPTDLTVLGKMSDDAPLVNSVVPLNEGRPDATDNGEYPLTTDSSRIDHGGKQTDKQAKSRRMSLADLQSKLQDIGHMITEKFDPSAYPSTAPIPLLTVPSPLRDEDVACLPMVNPDSDDHSSDVNPCATPDRLKFDGQDNRTEMLTLSKSKPWTSRLSLASFQPKLPRRSKPPSLNQEGSTRKGEATVRLRECEFLMAERDCDGSEIRNINEETLPEISSEEDLSGTVDVGIFRDREQEAVPSLPAAEVEADEPIQNVAQGLKRPFPDDGHECDLPDERKLRSLATLSNELELSANGAQSDSNMVDIVGMNPPCFMTKTLDSTNFSNCSLNQRSEGTIEMSAHRSSQYVIDHELFLQKLDGGSITVREFLELFAIEINIHRPRQSALPENFQMDSAPSAAVVLQEKHINRPKQRVYEEDCEELTAMVEKLKTRMKDQDKSLRSTNEALWEAVKSYSTEQFHSLGTKLKDRRAFFRKKSKTLAHELKIGLYSKLVQTTQIAQESLTGKIEGMDELLNHLDECLNDLQAELSSMDSAGVEEDTALSETKLAIEVKQQELETLDTVLADNERRVCELELERNTAKAKARKLQEETRELEKRIDVIDGLTEWRVSERTAERAVFTFLYESMGLEVLFEKAADGAVTDADTEQKISDITFQLELDEEKSQCHARLVHSLLSQYIENENSWTQRYPTSLRIPALLHDVALVVGRCRLLGEEVHRLKKWGSLSLDILELDCVETQVKILFSSIKAFAKFEVMLAVSPAYPFTALQLKSFRNYIGNTRIGQVQEIVTSETLAKNLLTRTVRRIHSVLLS